MGIKIPKMGMISKIKTPKPVINLADALFSGTQQRVLALLFGQPERSYYANEMIALAGAGSGAMQRELARLEQSGLATVRHVGNQKHYQANPASPIFAELCGIARKTVALAEPLKAALEPVRAQIIAAFIYGSVAKRQDTASSDVDVMIVSDTLRYADVFVLIEPLHERVGRTVNPTLLTLDELRRRIAADRAFTKRVFAQSKIWLVGSETDIGA